MLALVSFLHLTDSKLQCHLGPSSIFMATVKCSSYSTELCFNSFIIPLPDKGLVYREIDHREGMLY